MGRFQLERSPCCQPRAGSRKSFTGPYSSPCSGPRAWARQAPVRLPCRFRSTLKYPSSLASGGNSFSSRKLQEVRVPVPRGGDQQNVGHPGWNYRNHTADLIVFAPDLVAGAGYVRVPVPGSRVYG